MASNTRITWKRRTRKHVNMGKKRKAKESRKSTPSAAELFADMGAARGQAARAAAAKSEVAVPAVAIEAGSLLAAEVGPSRTTEMSRELTLTRNCEVTWRATVAAAADPVSDARPNRMKFCPNCQSQVSRRR